VLLRVLGPLEVSGPGGPVALGAAKPRTLLAALAMQRGRAVNTDLLMDALWGEDPPTSASKLIQVYVSQLRKALPAGVVIATTATGYRLDVDPADTDADGFERLLADGRAALAAGNPALASSALSRALALWRGPAYADVRYDEFARAEVERLERLRALALEERIDADLRLGRHTEILAGLRGLLAADPANERLAGQTMLAAYRAAGTASALEIFETVRAALAAEIGEEPEPPLQALRDQIARQDPSLALEPVSEFRTALPAPPNPLIGRERELAELRALLARPGVRFVSLTGAGGSGKSRLALELARSLESEYANGAVLIELASLSDPELVLPSIAQVLGVEPGKDAFDAVSNALAAKEILLVVDNVEHLREAASLLVRLLAVAPRVGLVITTRAVLHASGEHVYPVGPLVETDAVALFAERARALDPTFALDETSAPQIAAICGRLDGLPLPIELAAARVRTLGLRTLDARLASRLTLLTGGPRDLPARQQTLRETIAWSVNLLEPRVAEVLAALAVFPASCSMDAAEAVAGADDESLISLVDHNLVQALEIDGERRFRLLETVREYAYEALGARREAVESALATWMVGVVESLALGTTGPPEAASLAVLDVELDCLRQALRHAARDSDPERELALASGTWSYWWVRGYLAEGRAICDGILDRRGLVDTRTGIRTARAAANLAWSMGDKDRAERLAQDTLAATLRTGDVIEQVSTHNLLGHVARGRSELDAAEHHYSEAIRLAESLGNLELVNMYRMNLGTVDLDAGRLDEARDRFLAVLEYRRPEGLSRGVGFARLNLGDTELHAGDLAAAESNFVVAAEAFRAVGFKARLANALQGLAAVEARTGRADLAARRLGSAAALIAETGWAAGDSDLEAAATAVARKALGDEAFDRLFSEGAGSGAA
jgi:predicted ATPase/DNA-binding SARP family transcriptional activator